MITETSAVMPITASDVPCARCCVSPSTPVGIGIITMPPPTPNIPPAIPATSPASSAPRMRRALTRDSRVTLDLLVGGSIDEAHHVREPRGVGGRAQHHRDEIASLHPD